MLTELLGVKKYADKSASDIVDELFDGQGKGKLRYLGAGANAVAVTNGTIVYKFWLYDPCFDAWVDYCRANPKVPELPKYYTKIKTMPLFFKVSDKAREKVGNRLKYVQMEKLSQTNAIPYWSIFNHNPALAALTEAAKAANVPLHVANTLDASYVGDLAEKGLLDNNYSKNIAVVLDAHSKLRNLKFDFMRYISQVSEETGKAAWLLKEIAIIAKKHGGTLDFAEDNFAMRGKQFVYLDPLASHGAVIFNAEALGFM
jgi:hypothetical protein